MANTKCYALRQISKIRAFSSSASLSLKEHSPTIFHTRWWFFSCFVVDIPGMFTFLAVSLLIQLKNKTKLDRCIFGLLKNNLWAITLELRKFRIQNFQAIVVNKLIQPLD